MSNKYSGWVAFTDSSDQHMTELANQGTDHMCWELIRFGMREFTDMRVSNSHWNTLESRQNRGDIKEMLGTEATFTSPNSNVGMGSINHFGGFAYDNPSTYANMAKFNGNYVTVSGTVSTGVGEMCEEIHQGLNNGGMDTINDIVAFAVSKNFTGIDLNIEGIGDFGVDEISYLQDIYITWLSDFVAAAHAAGLKFRFDTVPESLIRDNESDTHTAPGRTQNHGIWKNRYVQHIPIDYIVLMTYDQNSNEGPTPTASKAFVEDAIMSAQRYFTNEQIIVGTPNYGYVKQNSVGGNGVVHFANQFIDYYDYGVIFDDNVRVDGELYATGDFNQNNRQDHKNGIGRSPGHAYFSDYKAFKMKIQWAEALGITQFSMWVADRKGDWFFDDKNRGLLTGSPGLTCPEGYHEENGVCVPDEVIQEQGPKIFLYDNIEIVKFTIGYGGTLLEKFDLYNENGTMVYHSIPINQEFNWLVENFPSGVKISKIVVHNISANEKYFEGENEFGELVINPTIPVVDPSITSCPEGFHEENGVCVPDDIETGVTETVYTRGPAHDDLDLSIFSYPHWYAPDDPERSTKNIDIEIPRDLPLGCKRMYFEFLYIYAPRMDLEPRAIDHRGDSVGVTIVEKGLKRFDDPDNPRLKGGYSTEYVDLIKSVIPEPYLTVSGLAIDKKKDETGEKPPNVDWFLTQSEEYIKHTIQYIVDFAKYKCCFKGINLNIERIPHSTIPAAKYIKFFEDITAECHLHNLKIIMTTQTERFLAHKIAYYDIPDGNPVYTDHADGVIKPIHRQPAGEFTNTMLYHIPFDYINYMVIDNFWQMGDKIGGHYDYETLKFFLDAASVEDPLFQERTIIQFSNYGVWGYHSGHFNADGSVAISDLERGIYMDTKWNGVEEKYDYMIMTKPQILGLLAGNEQAADLWRWYIPENDDIRWDESAGYSLDQGTRLPSGDLVIRLGDGHINRRDVLGDSEQYDGQYKMIAGTFLMYSDEFAISQRLKWVFDNYGLRKYSLWHAGKDQDWFSEESIAHINDGNGYPVYSIDNTCSQRPDFSDIIYNTVFITNPDGTETVYKYLISKTVIDNRGDEITTDRLHPELSHTKINTYDVISPDTYNEGFYHVIPGTAPPEPKKKKKFLDTGMVSLFLGFVVAYIMFNNDRDEK